MKAKFALDKKTIQEFFLQHSEKIVLGLAVVGLLAFAYAAIGRPTFPNTPQELTELANNARQNLLRTPGQSDLKITDYSKRADDAERPVDESSYRAEAPWAPPVFKAHGKRGDPMTYAVEKLAAAAGFGAISAKQGPSHGYHWVVLTGLVPLSQQREAYQECFRDAYPRGPETEGPKYVDFEVSRAEVQGQSAANPPWTAADVAKAFDKAKPNSDASGESPWKALDVDTAFKLVKSWGGTAAELVDKRFVDADGVLVYPLAQRVGGEWGAEVAHLPDIPVGDVGTPAPAPAPVEEEKHTTGHRHGAAAEAATSETPAVKPPEADAAKPEGAKYFLFRFMDFTAEPGKRYSYSVKLILKNPNHNIETRYLLDASLAKKEDLETRWSDPSEVVVVPRDDQLLVKEVKAPPRVSDQPAAALVLLKFVPDQGQQFFAEQSAVNRGQLINFANRPAQNVMPAAAGPEAPPAAPVNLDTAAEATPAKPGHAKPADTGPHINFDTGMVLIDVRGGERQPGRDAAKEPAEMLFLDVDGSLVARDEIRDAEEVQRIMGLKPPPVPVVRPAKPVRTLHPVPPEGPGGATPGRGTRRTHATTPTP
jgi:hypothetical protein